MKSEALLYIPSDTPEAMVAATMKVAGVPIVVRGIMTLYSAGIQSVTLLIAETQRAKIENFLLRYKNRPLPKISILSYDEPYRVSPKIVETIQKETDHDLIFINANLLFDTDIIQMIRSFSARGREILVCRRGVHHIPIMKLTRTSLAALVSFTSAEPRSIESCIRFLTEQAFIREVQQPHHSNTFLVHRLRERVLAEKFLAESIRLKTSGPIAKYINKKISLPMSLILSRLWVSPNAITAFNIVIGIFSGVFVADGHRYAVILFGAVLFQIASIVDGCDGEVAKLTFRCSKFGQYIDSVSDTLSLGSFMTGLIAGYWRHTHSHVAFMAGAVMIFSTFMTLFWMILYLKRNTNSASLVTFDTDYLQKLKNQPRWLTTFIKYGKYTLKKDVFSFIFLLFAAAGILYWWLFIAAFGTALSAITLTYLNLQGSARHQAEYASVDPGSRETVS
jgi:phosphatidylglycerophosphate synthase